MIIECVCLYCNHTWIVKYDWQMAGCVKCKSENPRIKRYDEKSKIDYYQGAPPFPNVVKDEDYDSLL